MLKVLLVEDDINDAIFIKDCITKFIRPADLVHVDNGAEALEYLNHVDSYENKRVSENLKLILLDLKTPKLNGLEVLEKIKTDEFTKNIPVVVITSSKEKKDQINSYSLGANSFIIKPIEYTQFERTLTAVAEYWLKTNQS